MRSALEYGFSPLAVRREGGVCFIKEESVELPIGLHKHCAQSNVTVTRSNRKLL